jgi:2-polyprenyl-3-methyl-5-hydroxy-6-metoxy-1,4-benzoquinol methylase
MADEHFTSTGSSAFARSVYSSVYSDYDRDFELRLGPINSNNILRDPRRLLFILARYKFVAKMLEGSDTVFEVGCQEGFGSLLVAGSVKSLTATDFDKPHIDSCVGRYADHFPNIDFRVHDIVDGPLSGEYRAGFAMDVLEHIDPAQEDLFMRHIVQSLEAEGVFIVGTPSLESQVHASEGSKRGHINCKSGTDLRAFCARFFTHVFLFGMNDEVLHTGFPGMSHYLFTLCCNPRK